MTAINSVESADGKPPKIGVAPLLFVAVLGALLSSVVISIVAYCLLHFGKLRVPTVTLAKESENRSLPPRCVSLEPILANLSDSGGDAYLRLGLSLQVEDAEESRRPGQDHAGSKTASSDIAALRDTILDVVGQKSSNDLLSPDGKEHLKNGLKNALAKRNPDIKVREIYFTEFLVQK